MDTENLINKEKTAKLETLDIGFKRTCSCREKHINCLSGKEWVKSQVAVQEFYYTKDDIRDKNIHPATFPIALPMKFIEIFTHKGELVIDPFVGTGTTLLAARNLGRNAVGFDLKKEYVDFAQKRLKQTTLTGDTKQVVVHDDALKIGQYIKPDTVSLCVTSPPYATMLNKPRLNKSMRADLRKNEHYLKIQQYSDNPRDLGTMDVPKYAEAMGEIYKEIFPLIKPKGHCVINVNDLWWENRRILTHVYLIAALEKVGFELRNILIWDKRNLVNNVGIFGYPSNYITLGSTFEYLLDFWKPKIEDNLPK